MTLDNIQGHRDQLFAAGRATKLMSGIKNYILTIEQGEKTGFHLHVVLLLCKASA